MDAVAGLNIAKTVEVETAQHLSEVLQGASEAGTPVIPVGGGTYLSTGHAVDHEFTAIDTSALNGIVDYIPTDMTAGFLAGTPMRIVVESLAEHGQELPIDLAEDDAGTIGGLVATGFSGPRRYGQGTLKDLLIGCEYVRGDGLIAKAGGMTVKNVSGFEITRMLHGSWGSLAVLTRVNLKVIPKARIDRTLVWNNTGLESALSRQQRLLEHFPGAVAIQTVQRSDSWETSVRFTGREPAVDDYQKQASGLEGEPTVLDDDRGHWAMTPGTEQQPQLVVSALSGELESISTGLLSAGGVGGFSVSYGTGTIQAQIEPGDFDAKTLASISSDLWMIEGGDDVWKRDVPVWGPVRADRAVMQSVKHQFDPANILNRDRLFI